MSTILVTGGFGFIGSHLVRRLLQSGHAVVNVDLETYAGDPRRLEILAGVDHVRADVADDGFLEIVQSHHPDAIVHLAAETHVTRSERDAAGFFRTNVVGTENALATASGGLVEHVLHVSTDEVYGPCTGDAFQESDKEPGEGLATSPYARSKALADDLATEAAETFSVGVARLTNCFGPWQHPEKAVPRWIARALSDRDLPVWGDGRQVRDWMFVEDAVEALEMLLMQRVRGPVNVGAEQGDVTNLEIATAIQEIVGRGRVYLTSYDRPQHDRRYAIDPSRLRSLGWSRSTHWRDGLARTVAWYDQNRNWWQPLLSEAEGLYDDSEARA